MIVADAQFGGQRLQFAVLAAVAGLAVAVVFGQQQFDDQPPRLAHAARVGVDLHALGDRHGTGRGQVHHPFDLDHADAAGADGLQSFDVAERGDADARLLSGVQDRGAFGDFDGRIVDRQLDHGRLLACRDHEFYLSANMSIWLHQVSAPSTSLDARQE